MRYPSMWDRYPFNNWHRAIKKHKVMQSVWFVLSFVHSVWLSAGLQKVISRFHWNLGCCDRKELTSDDPLFKISWNFYRLKIQLKLKLGQRRQLLHYDVLWCMGVSQCLWCSNTALYLHPPVHRTLAAFNKPAIRRVPALDLQRLIKVIYSYSVL